MALPENNIAWPPKQYASRNNRMGEYSDWYAGDPDVLARRYGGDSSRTGYGTGGGVLRRAVNTAREYFWGRPTPAGEAMTKRHVDLPRDLAVISSELLHADPPTVVVVGPRLPADGESGDGPVSVNYTGEASPQVVTVQRRLDEVLGKIGWESLLLVAAETCSPLGSVALRVGWDKTIAPDHPFITRIDADAYIPEYRWGMLTAVTFWSVVKQKTGEVWRHLERHERGAIYHGLYKGTESNLGMQVPLTDSEATAPLADLVDEFGRIMIDPSAFTAVSIPNMLPDPLDRHAAIGRSDFTPGIVSLFDALDEIYTSLMRDIELAKARLVVPEYMVKDNGPGKGTSFDDAKILSPLNMQPTEKGDASITMVQFAIRVQDHLAAAEHITARAIKSAGYNPQTMGDAADSNAMTATETLSRDRRSRSTRDKKIRYWQPALESLLMSLLIVDRDEFGQPLDLTDVRVEVNYPDAVQPDLAVLANTAKAMRDAESASLKVRVQVLHPDWDESQVTAEVAAIQSENSAVDPVSFGLGGVDSQGNQLAGF